MQANNKSFYGFTRELTEIQQNALDHDLALWKIE